MSSPDPVIPTSAAWSGTIYQAERDAGQKTAVSWAWRLGVAALSYLPIYFAFGMIVAPFVLPYYNNPDLGLHLAVPGIGVILPLGSGGACSSP